MSGRHTLAETERAVSGRLGGPQLDFAAMAAVQNLHRAASAIRNHFEQTVLGEAGLSWTGFVVLWVTWIWDSLETRDAAEEAGISKGTLTGVVKTLESKGLVRRASLPADGRLVQLQITAAGQQLMLRLLPKVNATEVYTVSPLEPADIDHLAGSLRRILTHLEIERDRGWVPGRRPAVDREDGPGHPKRAAALSAANLRATAAPIPVPPPVITAIRPSSQPPVPDSAIETSR
jgi:MarR family transcriptional regulator, organic hydroperoxide resistance regulator